MTYQKLGDFLSGLIVEILGKWKMFSNIIMIKKAKNNIEKRKKRSAPFFGNSDICHY